jgi:ubiquinone/menaquinone biosynthesis C-methylase UbiE
MLAHPDAVALALRPDPGMKVADFGAGQGAHMHAFSGMVGPSGRLYLFDVQKALVDRLAVHAQRQNLANVDPLWADLEVPRSTGLAEGSIDRVLLSHILFQADSREAVLAEAFRILKPGGKVLVVEWAPGAPAAALHTDRIVEPVKLAALLEGVGFGKLAPVPVGAAQHATLAEKPAA